MLPEQELTTLLQMLPKLCQHLGVNVECSKQEVQSFSKTTDVHKLASELDDKPRRNNEPRDVSIYLTRGVSDNFRVAHYSGPIRRVRWSTGGLFSG